MPASFSRHLLQFAHATDIVPGPSLNSALDSVFVFLQRMLEAHVFEVLRPELVNGAEGLRTRFQRGANEWTRSLRNPEGEYEGHLSYAYAESRRLWVTIEDPKSKPGEFQEHWAGLSSEDLPPFEHVAADDVAIKTSILIPLHLGSVNIGAMAIESPSLVKPTDPLKAELKRIAESVAFLLDREASFKRQQAGTQVALEQLGRSAADARLPGHSVFLAYPSAGDQLVVGIVKQVLAEVVPHLAVFDWAEHRKTGNVVEGLSDAIARCQFGVCYFSEPETDSGEIAFRDNANVLFEAGMLESVGREDSKDIWLPVRELASPEAPFDFRNARIAHVERTQDGVNVPLLKDKLRGFIETLDKDTRPG